MEHFDYNRNITKKYNYNRNVTKNTLKISPKYFLTSYMILKMNENKFQYNIYIHIQVKQNKCNFNAVNVKSNHFFKNYILFTIRQVYWPMLGKMWPPIFFIANFFGLLYNSANYFSGHTLKFPKVSKLNTQTNNGLRASKTLLTIENEER